MPACCCSSVPSSSISSSTGWRACARMRTPTPTSPGCGPRSPSCCSWRSWSWPCACCGSTGAPSGRRRAAASSGPPSRACSSPSSPGRRSPRRCSPAAGIDHALSELVLGHGLWIALPGRRLHRRRDRAAAARRRRRRGLAPGDRGDARSAPEPLHPSLRAAPAAGAAARPRPPSGEPRAASRRCSTRLSNDNHNERNHMRHRKLAAAIAVASLAAPAAAQAHVTLQPSEVPAGGFTRLDVRVPNERDEAGTTKIEVQFPPGFASVSTEPEAGLEDEGGQAQGRGPGRAARREVRPGGRHRHVHRGEGHADRARRVRRLRPVARDAGQGGGGADVQGAPDLRGRRGRPLDRRRPTRRSRRRR